MDEERISSEENITEEEKTETVSDDGNAEKKTIIETISKHSKTDSTKNKVIWSIVFVIIVAMTIFAITSQGDFSFTEFVGFLKNLKPGWLILAFVSMLGIILFEALAILNVARSFGYKKSIAHGYIYASGDIYFSAITPSATGGQPACAFFMMKDGIPGPMVTLTLVVNLIMYTFGILILGIASFIMNPAIFLGFSTFSKILIVIGSATLCLIATAFIIILVKSSVLYRICDWGLDLLAKLHLIRNLERKKKKLRDSIDTYACHVHQLGGKRKMLVGTLILNVCQRASAVAVTLFVFFAAGGEISSGIDVWVSQCMVILGSNTVPIPGAMGISDFLLIDAFGAIGFSDGAAMSLNLLSRTVSFYTCVVLCGASMIVRMISYKVIEKRKTDLINNYTKERLKKQ